MKISLKESQLRNIILESVKTILCEVQNTVDNFDLIANKILEFPNQGDDFFFIQIIKRKKDNPYDDPSVGNYHAGGWYLNSWRIHSVDELLSLKPQIIKICNDNNARAYITINYRSENETNSYVNIYRSKYNTNDPRYINADDIVAGAAKSGANWKDVRKRLFLDIDLPKTAYLLHNRIVIDDGRPNSAIKLMGINVWDDVHDILKRYNIDIITEYESPSGGLHIVLPDKNDLNLHKCKQEFLKYDRGRDLRKRSAVGMDEDAKLILYSNVQTAGY